MNEQLSRKGALDTMSEALEWLTRNPALILAFLVVGLLDGLGEVSAPLSLLAFLLLIAVDGVAHRIAFAEARGSSTTIGDEVGPVLGRYLSLLGAWILYSIAVVVGLLLLIVPGVYLGLRLSLAFPAIVIDDEGAIEGARTSWDVAQGNLLKLLGISVLAVIVALSTLIAAGIVTALFDSIAALVLISAVLTAILSPIVQMAYARVYLENRDADAPTTDDQSDAGGRGADDGWGREDDRGGDGWGTTDEESAWSTDDRDDRR